MSRPGGSDLGRGSLRSLFVALSAVAAGGAWLSIACTSAREPRSVHAWAVEDLGACTPCHADAAGVLEHGHAGHRESVGCVDCHAPHPPSPDGSPGPAPIRRTCEQCHPEVLGEFRLPFAHPLGISVDCTSCHDPHGRPLRDRLRHEREDACFECHSEKRGPFVHPHEGDKTQGCLSCHLPHGSPNRRLLTHADSRSLCFSCHEVIDDFHIQNPGSIFRDCLNCHTEVHGTNWGEALLR
jgi:DmsE family decaheme c-type cytochrome